MNPELRPLSPVRAFAIFGAFGALLHLATHAGIPLLRQRMDIEALPAWFLAGGAVFASLALTAALMYAREGRPWTWAALAARLRLVRLRGSDLPWIAGGVVAMGMGVGLLMLLGQIATGAPIDPAPSFMAVEPLGPGRYWILGAWLPFFAFNILGEELLWRGILLPRQEAAQGARAWLLHGLGHVVFHIPFGLPLLLMTTPIALVIAYAASRRQSTTVAIALHAIINGPTFVLVALGIL